MEKELWAEERVRVFLSRAEDTAVRSEIHEQIKAFNDATSPAHRQARKPGSIQPLHVLVRDEEGRLRGGLIADTYWDWLDLEDFWLEAALRGNGLGARVLRAAEEEAIERGCKNAKLETFSFQARGFYEKFGYRVVGRLDGYPPGQSFYWMSKELGEPPAAG